jgi:UDP-glucuronate 4-epimerase
MNILVTGSVGFIGYHLVNQLLKTKHKIYGCDNLSSNSFKTQKKRFELLKKKKKFDLKKFDLKHYDKFANYYSKKKINLIIHLAAQPGVRISQEKPLTTVDQNIKTFINLMEFCKKNNVKDFFYASSSSVYGNENKFIESFKKNKVSSVYAASKVCNEIFANVYNYLYGINTLGLRFFTVYGPYGREDMAYYKFLKQIKSKKMITIYGGKKAERSFTYIDDVTKSIILLIKKFYKKNTYNEQINIGNYKKNSLNDLIKSIKKYYTKNFKEIVVNRNKADVLKTHSSIKKLKKNIKFYPKTSLDKGMKVFIEWFKNF